MTTETFKVTESEILDYLNHAGVKGMKWGVRKDKGHEGEAIKTKKLAKLDKKFERDAASFATFAKVHNAAAQRSNDVDVPRINNKPEYKGKDFSRDSPLRQKYYKEHQDAFLDNAEKAAKEMGTNASGTKKLKIFEQPDGSWNLELVDVKHADTDEMAINIKVSYDVQGHITKIHPPSATVLAQSQMDISEEDLASFLEHYGVKGQKWGVQRSAASKARAAAREPQSADSANAQKQRTRAKASGVQALTNKEIQDVLNRANLESQYKRATRGPVQKGADLVLNILGNVGKETAKAAVGGKVRDTIGLGGSKKGIDANVPNWINQG